MGAALRGVMVGCAAGTLLAAAGCSTAPTDAGSPSLRTATSSASSSPTTTAVPLGTDPPATGGSPPAGPSSTAPTDPRAETAKPAGDGRQTAVLARVPGSASASTCVVVGTRRDVRSGSILGGPFDDAIAQWGKAQQGVPTHSVLLYWVPLNTAKMPGVSVTATNPATGTKLTVKSTVVGDAEQWKYYSTRIVLRDAGTWRLAVSSGPDRGCFEITLKG